MADVTVSLGAVAPLVAPVLVAAAVWAWPRRVSARARLAGLRLSPTSAAAGPGRWAAPGVPVATRPADRRLGAGGAGRLQARLSASRRPSAAESDRAVIAMLEALAAALRAGLAPPQALSHVAVMGRLGPDSAPAGTPGRAKLRGWLDRSSAGRRAEEPLSAFTARLAGQAASGARLEPALRAEAERRASPALLALAAGWGMSERYGAPVVEVIDGLVDGRRDAARNAAAVETALAAPRATASLLAALPFGGVLLGEVVGVNPVTTLVSTAFGRVDLALGLLATWGGRVWMRRLVAAVSRER